MQSFAEKRGDMRVEFNGEVKFKILSENESNIVADYETAMSKNISRGGICIVAPHKFSEGSVVRVEIPGVQDADHSIKAFCEVLWCTTDREKEKFEAGLSFIALKEDDMDLLQDFVTKHRAM